VEEHLKGRNVVVSLLVVVVAGAGLWYAWPRKPPPKPPRFNGIRGQMVNATYTQEDPVAGTLLIIRAGRADNRDGKVGKLFRSPLKPMLELTSAEGELKAKDGTLLITAKAPSGEYDPVKGVLTLVSPSEIKVGDREIRAGSLTLRADGTASILESYEVFKGGASQGKGQGYSGRAAEIGVKR
jgi:hypothetical protein